MVSVMPLARPRRARIAFLLLVPALIAWMVTAACGGGGSDGVGADASADGRPDTSFDAGYLPPEEDATPRDATSGKDAALPPPYCPAPIACADAGTSPAELAHLAGAQIEGIAADGCDVYWGEQGGNIRRVSRCGGTVTTIATAQPYAVTGVTLDAYSVYWTAGGVVRSARKDDPGGVVVTLASATNPSAIAVDDAFVYWTEEPTSAGRVWRAPLAGGGARSEVAVIGYGSPFGMALDTDRVFFEHDGQIASAPKDGGASADLAPTGGLVGTDIACIAVDDANVYYTLYESGAVMRVPKTGGDGGVFAPASRPRCLAIDDASVYWVNDAQDGGGLMRAAKDGGSPTAITTSPGNDSYAFVALDESYAYWGYAGRILRAPK